MIRSVESERMKGKNNKDIGMMSVELRGRRMMFSSQYAGDARRSTACASFVSHIEACRMIWEEYNARARQAGMHAKDSSITGNSRQWACGVRHYAAGRWRGRAAWSRGSAW